jgi:hypothetical protein
LLSKNPRDPASLAPSRKATRRLRSGFLVPNRTRRRNKRRAGFPARLLFRCAGLRPSSNILPRKRRLVTRFRGGGSPLLGVELNRPRMRAHTWSNVDSNRRAWVRTPGFEPGRRRPSATRPRLDTRLIRPSRPDAGTRGFEPVLDAFLPVLGAPRTHPRRGEGRHSRAALWAGRGSRVSRSRDTPDIGRFQGVAAHAFRSPRILPLPSLTRLPSRPHGRRLG